MKYFLSTTSLSLTILSHGIYAANLTDVATVMPTAQASSISLEYDRMSDYEECQSAFILVDGDSTFRSVDIDSVYTPIDYVRVAQTIAEEMQKKEQTIVDLERSVAEKSQELAALDKMCHNAQEKLAEVEKNRLEAIDNANAEADRKLQAAVERAAAAVERAAAAEKFKKTAAEQVNKAAAEMEKARRRFDTMVNTKEIRKEIRESYYVMASTEMEDDLETANIVLLSAKEYDDPRTPESKKAEYRRIYPSVKAARERLANFYEEMGAQYFADEWRKSIGLTRPLSSDLASIVPPTRSRD
jgi:predicted phage tail protein